MKTLFLPLAVAAGDGALARAVSRELAFRTGRAGGAECALLPFVHLVEGRRVLAAYGRRLAGGDLARLLEAAPESDFLVHGDLEPGDPFSLALAVLRRSDLEPVAEQAFSAPRFEGFRAFAGAARFVLDATGLTGLPEVLEACPTRTFEGFLALLVARDAAAMLDGWGEPGDPFAPWLEALDVEPGCATVTEELGLFAMDAVRRGLVTPQAAEQALVRAAEAAPRRFRTWAALGQVRMSAGAPVEAEAALRKALELDPGRAALRFDLGMALLAQGRAGPAAKAFETVKADPACGTRALFELGRIRAAKGDPEGAAELWREAAGREPASPEVLAALGSALSARGEFDEAERAFRRGLEARDPGGGIHLAFGVHLAEQDRHEEAGEHLREAIRHLPDRPEARFHLGRAYAATGERHRALHHLRKAMAAGHPGAAEVADELAGPGRSAGLIDLLRQAVDQPAEDQVPLLKALLREEATYAEARVRLGIALVARGKARAAEGHFRKALKVEPGDPEALSGLATALKARRKFERAIEAHRQAIQRAPGHAAYHLNLADTLLRAGRGREAARAVDVARALEPGHPLLGEFALAVKRLLSDGGRPKEEG